MRILIAGLVMCVAGCSSYYNGPLAYSKRGPIEPAEPAPDHNSLNADNQRQMGMQLQNAEYKRAQPRCSALPIARGAASSPLGPSMPPTARTEARGQSRRGGAAG